MSRLMTRSLVPAAILFGLAGTAAAQTAGPSGAGIERVRALVENPNLPRDIDPVFAPPGRKPTPPPDGSEVPAPPAPPPELPRSALTDFKLSQTYLPRIGTGGFGNHDTEFSVQYALPGWEPLSKQLLLRGGFGVHAWDGPGRDPLGRDPGLPGAVYDLYLDVGWKPRPAEWLFLDLGVTPGLYTDLRAFPHEAFRLRGRALSIVALSEKFQFVAGVLYVNRNAKNLIPAGGFVWSPDDGTKLQVVFPQPKLARRVGVFGETAWWLYAAGEFGGGTWAYERPDGSANSVDYNDYRVILGSEFRRADGWCLRAEAGYVFGRELVPLNAPRVTPTDTVMLRLALVF
jgi:hypothetical protein